MEIFLKALDLPEEWDVLCGDNYALKREFLHGMELGNPASQKYYLFRNASGALDSFFVTYIAPRQNITLYTPINFKVRVTFVHVPLSVTREGYVLGEETKAESIKAIQAIKGYVIVLNARSNIFDSHFAHGYTASQISMKLVWNSFDEYLNSLRSGYRYRYKKALKKFSGASVKVLNDTADFTPEMYQLYENVYNNSRIKAEKLTIEYFRRIKSRIFVSYDNDKPIGFIQLIENGDELIFAFVGLDYSCNKRFDTYFGLLLYMIKYGIDHRFSILEMGQTAEDAKLKLGGEYTQMSVLIHHSNRIVLWFVKMIIKAISYREYKNVFNVFNSESKE